MSPHGYFNSRPCGRGDREEVRYFHQNLISIHAPAGGATRRVELFKAGNYISIHAPAGGATFGNIPVNLPLHISIHAPAGGATPMRMLMVLLLAIFQFTPLREGRHKGFSQ